ncbi:MAG: hypothetical protein WCH57_05975 [Verrucomicrobiota bacterium]
MFENRRGKSLCRALAALALGLAAWAAAGADPIKIVFLPPPMEGNLSLGVYDTAGTLVRVLHREAEWSEFTAGDDGLATQWDGKDDRGAACPSGTYRVRGVAVGDLGVEGVDFIGNDWVTNDDAPHLQRITDLGVSESGTPFLAAQLPGQNTPTFYSISLKPAAAPGEDLEVQLVPEKQRPPTRMFKARIPKWAQATKGWVYGSNGSIWAIEGDALKQYSSTDKPLRLLPPQADDPAPVKLAASLTEEKLYVLYENAALQRLRGYDFTGVKPGGAPKVLFENDIVFSDRYEQIAAELKFPDGKPFTASPVLNVALQPNPLAGNKPGTLLIRAAVDKEGAYLAAADGLPLCHISETKAMAWAVLGRPAGGKAITVFDSDGAVVEQFQVSKIANMMPFDAGAVQWTAPAATPTPAPSVTPSATASPAAP